MTSDPCSQGAQLTALIPVACFETIPGAGDLVLEDTPAELTASALTGPAHPHLYLDLLEAADRRVVE